MPGLSCIDFFVGEILRVVDPRVSWFLISTEVASGCPEVFDMFLVCCDAMLSSNISHSWDPRGLVQGLLVAGWHIDLTILSLELIPP